MKRSAPSSFRGTDIFQKGFLPLHSYGQWRIMSSSVEQQERPSKLQKHERTDEVFVVVRGKGWMLLGECPMRLESYPMEEGMSYVVPAGMWHAHVLEAGSQLIIVENEDTGLENSPVTLLTTEQIAEYERLISAQRTEVDQ
mgnify:CR=1 FL=1